MQRFVFASSAAGLESLSREEDAVFVSVARQLALLRLSVDVKPKVSRRQLLGRGVERVLPSPLFDLSCSPPAAYAGGSRLSLWTGGAAVVRPPPLDISRSPTLSHGSNPGRSRLGSCGSDSGSAWCQFCYNNEACVAERAGRRLSPDADGGWRQHRLKDSHGNVTCPVLWKLRCRECGATGPAAHTLRYCPRHKGRLLRAKLR